ncbi:hypothetical protein AVEN_244053-1 [Araneus ventricosus]|uniref:Uncharacterized protein n=1 Tax=Araneus ventricosus TaxID=182803 RepID=A0A4Y2II12_ARAVE|nr:hypothetical protein AVEN_244053-1 [Araneus ventricosus]
MQRLNLPENNTEDYVMKHILPNTDSHLCGLITSQEDVIVKNHHYAQNCRATISALRKQGNNEALIESRVNELKTYEDRNLNSEGLLKRYGPCPIKS